MSKVSQLLKVMITTEKAGFGSYSHFTGNVLDLEKDLLYKYAKYESPVSLNGDRVLMHTTIQQGTTVYHVYYKHYQVIGFDKKGRPSSNLIAVLMAHPLSAENCRLLDKRLESIVHDLDKHKGHFTIHKVYETKFVSDINKKIHMTAKALKKSIKFIVLGLFGIGLFLFFLDLENKERVKIHAEIVESFHKKSLFEMIEFYNINMSSKESKPFLGEMQEELITKGDILAEEIDSLNKFKDVLKLAGEKNQSAEIFVAKIKSTVVYSTELEKKIEFFNKLNIEFQKLKETKNVRKIRAFLKNNSKYLSEADKLVLRGIIDEQIRK